MQRLQCHYINRGGDKAQLDQIVKHLGERQQFIENAEGKYGALCIFPEGACNNGLYLNKFRRGAFAAERAIQPYIMTYDWEMTSPGYDAVKGIHTGMLMASEFSMKTIRLDVFPNFVPNEYLFTEYRKTIPGGEKLERWEVYAHAVRDFISETGGFGLND